MRIRVARGDSKFGIELRGVKFSEANCLLDFLRRQAPLAREIGE